MSPGRSVTLRGTTFVVSDTAGDIAATSGGVGPLGLFHDDIRHLSCWRLTVDGRPLVAQHGGSAVGATTSQLAVLAASEPAPPPTLTVRRQRVVAEGPSALLERVRIANPGDTEARLALRLELDADFASVLRLHGVESPDPLGAAEVTRSVGGDTVVLARGDGTQARLTAVSCDRPAVADERGLTVELAVGSHEHADLVLQAVPLVGPEPQPAPRQADFDAAWADANADVRDWLEGHPAPQTPWEDLTVACRQGMAELALLRMRSPAAPEYVSVAAGVPWYVALFGRDSLLTSYFALPFAPDLAAGTLRALAQTQATAYDDGADAEPGKIGHELRAVAGLGDPPVDRYYGAVDTTPLFLVLLEEYVAWTGDRQLARDLEPAARAALAWLDDPRVLLDGWVSYERRSKGGLVNQCWKDSSTSIRFRDGRSAATPIATCEVQSYSFDALVRASRLATRVWHDHGLAERLRVRAARMKERFDSAFWLADRGCYALARDGSGRRVDSLTSNIGHLLWSGIVPDDRAEAIARHLVGGPLFSGWGVRTMAAGEAAYLPLGYHTGAVWPHDTALAAAGLVRYGYRREALALCAALVRAAAAFDRRLPEVFAGFSATEGEGPVEYPTSCQPQAWAAATPLLVARLVLDLHPDSGRPLDRDGCS